MQGHTQGIANYVHASIFSFTERGYSQVISQFHKQLGKDVAQCWFDKPSQTFRISTASHLGADADAALADIISNYVAKQIDAAEQEDSEQRIDIHHFPEGTYRCSVEDENPLCALTEPTSSSNKPSQIIKIRHTSSEPPSSECTSVHVQMIPYSKLPNGLCSRILLPDKKTAKKIMRFGLTCRLMLLDQEKQIFLPEQLAISPYCPQKSLFDLKRFDFLHNKRTVPSTVAMNRDEPIPGVDMMKWLAGVENMTLIDFGDESLSVVDRYGMISSVEPQFCLAGLYAKCNHEFCHALRDAARGKEGHDLVLETHIGMMIVQPTHYKTGLNGVFTLAEADELLNSSDLDVQTDFIERLTTSEADAYYIYKNCWPSSSPNMEHDILYEIHFRVPEVHGGQLVLKVPAADKANYSITSQLQDQVKGEAFLHYPSSVHDAHIVLRQTTWNLPTNNHFQTFVASMITLENAPSFAAMVTGGYFPTGVYAKRVFSHDFRNVTFFLSQVQQLAMKYETNDSYNFQAHTTGVQWWETRIETKNLNDATSITELTDSFVDRMDNIGSENRGFDVCKRRKQRSDADEKDMDLDMNGPKVWDYNTDEKKYTKHDIAW